MGVREKLVELLDNFHRDLSPFAGNEKLFVVDDNVEQAEYLIEHGVTVQEWISVEDRLPEEGEYVLCVLKGFNYGGKIQVCKFVPADKFTDKPYFEHFRNGFPSVTHWMPLPQPPKEVEQC